MSGVRALGAIYPSQHALTPTPTQLSPTQGSMCEIKITKYMRGARHCVNTMAARVPRQRCPCMRCRLVMPGVPARPRAPQPAACTPYLGPAPQGTRAWGLGTRVYARNTHDHHTHIHTHTHTRARARTHDHNDHHRRQRGQRCTGCGECPPPQRPCLISHRQHLATRASCTRVTHGGMRDGGGLCC